MKSHDTDVADDDYSLFDQGAFGFGRQRAVQFNSVAHDSDMLFRDAVTLHFHPLVGFVGSDHMVGEETG